jgi:hypothetical protein
MLCRYRFSTRPARPQPVIADVQWLYRLPGTAVQRVEQLLGPGFDVIQSIIGRQEGMGRPNLGATVQFATP